MSREEGTKWVGVASNRPAERMVVLNASAWVDDEDGSLGFESGYLPVVSLAVRMDEFGDFECVPIVVSGGKAKPLEDFELEDLPSIFRTATICCDWPRRQDEERLGGLLEAMTQEAIEEAKQLPSYRGDVEQN